MSNFRKSPTARQALCLCALSALALNVSAQTLSVRADGPDWYKIVRGNTAWNIVIEGQIDVGAANRVAEALSKAGRNGADVYLNSPGGNLLEGMRIGRLIRRAGANTWIGSLAPDASLASGGQRGLTHKPGSCHSACSLAFLGGVYRFVSAGDQYGVHRFSSNAPPAAGDLDSAQIISAAVGAYIREMGAEPALFDLIAERGPDSIRLLSTQELAELNVANNGRLPPTWSIEVVPGGQYLRGVQETMYGQGKIVFLCNAGTVRIQSFYEAGSERAQSLASGAWHHSLLVGDRVFALPGPTNPKANGDEFSAGFPLTREQVLSIRSGSSVGHAMQVSREAPTFVGYKVDISPAAATRVSTFLHNCLIAGR